MTGGGGGHELWAVTDATLAASAVIVKIRIIIVSFVVAVGCHALPPAGNKP